MSHDVVSVSSDKLAKDSRRTENPFRTSVVCFSSSFTLVDSLIMLKKRREPEKRAQFAHHIVSCALCVILPLCVCVCVCVCVWVCGCTVF